MSENSFAEQPQGPSELKQEVIALLEEDPESDLRIRLNDYTQAELKAVDYVANMIGESITSFVRGAEANEKGREARALIAEISDNARTGKKLSLEEKKDLEQRMGELAQ